MGRAFESLQRVIKLESEQGYHDRAVVGGIQQFAALWVSQARAEAEDEADLALVEQAAEMLSGYGQLSGTEARAAAISSLSDRLQAREKRLASVPSKKVAKPRPDAGPAPVAKESPPVQPIVEVEDEAEDDVVLEIDPELLRQPVNEIRGVGSVVAERLAVLGLYTIEDLLYHFHRKLLIG